MLGISLAGNISAGFLMVEGFWKGLLVSAIFTSLFFGIVLNQFLNAKRRLSEEKKNGLVRLLSFFLVVVGVFAGILTMSNLIMNSLGRDMFAEFATFFGVNENTILVSFIMSVSVLIELYVPVLILNLSGFWSAQQFQDEMESTTKSQEKIFVAKKKSDMAMLAQQKFEMTIPYQLKIHEEKLEAKLGGVIGSKTSEMTGEIDGKK